MDVSHAAKLLRQLKTQLMSEDLAVEAARLAAYRECAMCPAHADDDADLMPEYESDYDMDPDMEYAYDGGMDNGDIAYDDMDDDDMEIDEANPWHKRDGTFGHGARGSWSLRGTKNKQTSPGKSGSGSPSPCGRDARRRGQNTRCCCD